MILIFSNKYDESTNEVCNLLIRNENDFIRINDYNFFSELVLECYEGEKKPKIIYNKTDLIEEVTTVWYRREPEYEFLTDTNKGNVFNEISKSIYSELTVIKDYLIYRLRNKYWLNHPYRAGLNKIYVLDVAQSIGFNIPRWFVTNDKKVIEKRLKEDELITKPLFEIKKIKNGNKTYGIHTELITINKLQRITNLSISFLQSKVEKETEIRVVFLEGSIYAMEIFSQKNWDTKIDFRNYDNSNPLRFAAHKLPKELERKIQLLMEELNLNFGSLDFILTLSMEYVFLEVNPVGQFGMTSKPNNYDIEYRIAEILGK